MITIYGSKRSTGFRCYWLMEELGIPYETKELDFQKGENKSPEYLALNPNGKIPTMVDGNFVLWESLAINQYLIEKKNATELVGTTAEERGVINQWNYWSLIHLSEAFTPLVLQKYRKTPDSEMTKGAREQELPRYLGVLNAHLAGKNNVVLERFTLADITIASVLRNADFVELDLSTYPNIVAWMANIAERPAYKKLMTT